MIEKDPCPACGALPCDWVNDPTAKQPLTVAALSSAEMHQRRGMQADVILAALNEYDEWMKDDDYDARGCLDRVIRQLERARDVALAQKEGAP